MELAYDQDSTSLQTDPKIQLTVLCVDDEPSILASLKRSLRKQPYTLLTANNGIEALEILKEHSVDLVISDMRMPEMTGAELLSHVNKLYPNTMRILLTGYSDMESTVEAINDAKIHQYLSKPWENNELLLSIDRVLDQKILQDENRELSILTHKQNEELHELNKNLEAKVAERTQEIANANTLLQKTLDQLNESYEHSISVFSNLIELREGKLTGHGQNVANLSASIAASLQLDDQQLSDLNNAALLHDIGKLALSDELCTTPYISMNEKEREEYESHACIGQSALLSISALDNAGLIIRSHHENYDGKGFPDGLAGEEISIGARILTITSDFDDLQNGLLTGDQCTSEEAAMYIMSKSGGRYDPDLVKIFLEFVHTSEFERKAPEEMKVNYRELISGMVLSKNIVSDNGILMLREGQELRDSLIERIHRFIDDTHSCKVIHITGESVFAQTDIKTSDSH